MAVRAINSTGTATTGIVVDGVSLGDAVAGYTTYALALAASSNGDTLVITEESTAFTGTSTALTGLTVCAADNVRWSGGAYGNGAGFNTNADLAFTAASGTTTVKNLAIRNNSVNGYIRQNGAGHINVQRCVFQNAAAGYGSVIAQSSGTARVDNCRAEMAVQGGNTNFCWNFGTDLGLEVINTTIVFTSGAGTGAILIRGNSAALRVACANVQALRTNGASIPSACYFNAAAHPSYAAGNNMSSKTDAPGTTVYNSVIADDILAGVSPLDMRWKDRTTAELYPGVDVSATISDYDADFQARNDEWFVGADWIAATVAAVASASSIGFFLMSPFGMLFGLQDE